MRVWRLPLILISGIALGFGPGWAFGHRAGVQAMRSIAGALPVVANEDEFECPPGGKIIITRFIGGGSGRALDPQ